MKIRHPEVLRGAGFAVAWLVRAWIGTLRYRPVALEAKADPTVAGQKNRFIYCFWHEMLLLPAYCYQQTPTEVLISEHADGELIAQACRHLGLGTIRGSTTRGGAKALRRILKFGGRRNLVITPDGPQGPRQVFQPGAIYVASRTGLPIVPVGFAYHRCWRLRSWDRFALPYPGSPAVGVIGQPIEIPPELSRNEVETWRRKMQQEMDEVMMRAESLATKETW